MREIELPSYVESFVGPGEQIVYVGKVSLFSIMPSLIAGALLILVGCLAAIGGTLGSVSRDGTVVGLGVAVIGIIVLAAGLIRRNSTELAVTSRRVIAKFGLVRRSTVELNISKVESIRVEQTVMGRIFGYGSIIVTGTGSTIDPIPFIANPIKFRQAVQAATDAAQKA